jgi:transcriptional regulator with XRE-family HTH domain
MAEDTNIDRWVAIRLRALREQRGLTLTALAKLTGYSTAHLSRLEQGERQPSIGILLELARTYELSLSQLLEERPDQEYHLFRAGEGAGYDASDGRYRVLSGPGAAMAAVELTLPAGAETPQAHHGGEEWLHVKAGTVHLVLPKEEITLLANDSLHFDSSVPHRLANPLRRPATVLIVSTAVAKHHPLPGTI